MTGLIDRAHLLMAQDRWDQAAQELRGVLASQPDDPWAHALLATCLQQLKKPWDAMEMANRAVGLGPNLPYAHYVKAGILEDQSRFRESEASIREAIRLDPYS